METRIPLPRRGLRRVGSLLAAVAAFGLGLALLGSSIFSGEVDPGAGTAIRIMGSVLCLGFGLGAAYALSSAVEVCVGEGEVAVHTRRLGRTKIRRLPRDGQGVVELSTTVIPTSTTTRMDVWPITYHHPLGRLQLHRLTDANEGRAWCERFVELLGVPMLDLTAGEPEIRSVEEIDASVVERTDLDGVSWPSLAVDERLGVVVEPDGRVRVHIGPRGFGSPVVFGVAFAAMGTWGLTRSVDQIRAGVNLWGWIFGPLIALVFAGFCILGLYAIRHAFFGSEDIEVDPRGVRTPGGDLESAAIESVQLGRDAESVILRADEGTMVLGSGLRRDQAEALRDVVLLALGGRTPR